MDINELFPLQFCINLKSRQDRWLEVQEQFKFINLNNVQRFDAIKNNIGFMGCLQSHLAILKLAQKENKNVLIFEDDVLFINEKNILDSAIEDLFKIRWDMFYLGGNICGRCYPVSQNLAKLTHAQATQSYGINANFLNALIPIVEKWQNPIDILYGYQIVPNCLAYISIPMMGIQRPGYSDIEKKLVDYNWMVSRFEYCLMR
jgi:glycosyl transferase, family 25